MSDRGDHRVVLVGMSVCEAVADQAMVRLSGDVAPEQLQALARARTPPAG